MFNKARTLPVLLFIFGYTIICATVYPADTALEMLTRANQFYEEGDYTQASALYKNLLQTHYNGQLLYNIGNCAFKQHTLSKALLWYERAYRLLPRDKDIRTNIELCNMLLRDEIEEPLPGMFSRITGYPLKVISLNEWCWLTFVFYACSTGLFAVILFLDKTPLKKFLRWCAYSMVVIGFICGLYTGVETYHDQTRSYAILAIEESLLRSGPGDSYSSITRIHEGMKVLLRNRKNGWIQVSLTNGWNGWLKESELLPIRDSR